MTLNRYLRSTSHSTTSTTATTATTATSSSASSASTTSTVSASHASATTATTAPSTATATREASSSTRSIVYSRLEHDILHVVCEHYPSQRHTESHCRAITPVFFFVDEYSPLHLSN